MKLSLILIGIPLVVSITSCSQQKSILRGNEILRIVSTPPPAGPPGIPTFALHRYRVTNKFKSTVAEKDNYILLQSASINNSNTQEVLPATPLTLAPTGFRSDIIGKYYFDEQELIGPHTTSLWYFDTKLILQALTIPLKVRPKIKDAAYKDTFPTTVETGINVALAVGPKFTWNQYKSTKNFLGSNTHKFSLSFGGLFGLGATDLKKANTRKPVIEFERKAPLVTTGMFFMLGINNLNLGYSFGWDRAKGIGGDEWVYDGKIWHGITIGLDILK